ncbi:pyruvate dehydrogenase complex dihydrolipoyllysine-residue acetyltransferase [Gilvimarinus agarilyticus]|uniref:pyruvate dehydrogenase complex dihydrolipoyllysine-residue acetyltransferase n=1 Tax=unclassified Gilvimarinus TaxID=2642066 RepID=UPI001C091A24|nr:MULTISPECIES: pyruvate dehydrogenase complex dihydrolipoyllysine-residue acetyltransferase [unclassified Gilvimarinus]MBU2887335.1 pyruvate dehydrogenase complex dihydrolipoyllysine-residue acetyltransferase [Gilvimarinus agarilyticus]MDO6571994.1 pyruvate dehydrogenase complex dihydrolipoyllysine-residue acetyltransferase [Gilvimarinus sp. 2_MG-2023]MDO6746062.1 pyruvate dehydrogenase complex dihydrolipoyllysine-residue acetyltransferase [Gilvimarinus sp. 1_MG-2023]
MAIESVKVPDIGGSENVDVIEISVAVGDTVELDDSLVVLETDKASLEVPSTVAGVVKAIKVKEGDKVSEGDLVVEIETTAAAEPEAPAKAESAPAAESEPAQTSEQPIIVPDLGGSDNVDVIEVCVSAGDKVAEGDSLVVLETDKASLEIPAPADGTIVSIALKEGDKVSQGDTLGVMTGGAAAPAASESSAAPAEPAPAAGGSSIQDVPVPDIGGAEGVDVIELSVAEGDEVAEGDTLIVLETDKASMEIPAPAAGKIVKLAIKEGDKISQGDVICQLEGAAPAAPTKAKSEPAPAPAAQAPAKTTSAGSPVVADSEAVANNSADVYAGPSVRKLARQLGADLSKVKGTGPRSRITKDDLRSYVKNIVSATQEGRGTAGGGSGLPAMPAIDFSKFGEIETVKMSKIKKLTSDNMVRNWLNIPHVTQWDDADITELEAFRKGLKAEAEKRGSKLTPLPFLLKAAGAALVAEPSFNVSIHHDGEHIVQKKYVNIGVAVDTPNGLMVPVIRDVDKKGLWELADDFSALVKKAREGKLTAADMQGGCFTISSLGAMGGNGFTPIVNAPEVAILGVSKAQMKPVWNGKDFEPRNMLPLALSYDHRAINGADAGRFFTYLTAVIADVRRLLL